MKITKFYRKNISTSKTKSKTVSCLRGLSKKKVRKLNKVLILQQQVIVKTYLRGKNC